MTITDPIEKSNPPGDDDICDAIKRRLQRDRVVSGDDVNILVAEGIVTVAGAVHHLLEKKRISEIIASVRGVRAIIEKIDIEVKQRSDEMIMVAIDYAIGMDTVIPAGLITAHADSGHVTISGDLPSWGLKQLAEGAVLATDGIRSLQNSIEVKPQEDRPDVELEHEISELLCSNVWVDESMLSLQVENGVVVLSGSVGNVAQKTRARNIAWTPGAKSVDDSQLQVIPWMDNDMQDDSIYQIRTQDEVDTAVKDVLRYDPLISELDVIVTVDNGTATIEGIVNTLQTSRYVMQDIEDVVGVYNINNNLQIQFADHVTDGELSNSIAAALMKDPILENIDVEASANDGVARLEGKVETHFMYDRADSVVAGVNGVKEVRNNLHVIIPLNNETDSELKNDVEKELFWTPNVGSGGVSVSVDGGVVTLSGNVKTIKEKQVATTAVLTVGARKIHNGISVL